MNLDIDTLFIVNIFTASIISIVMFIIWRTQKSSSCLAWLSLAAFCLMIGGLLVPAREYLPSFLFIILANTIYLLWTMSIWLGIRDFQGLFLPLKKLLLSLCLFLCLLVYYVYIDFDAGMRIIILSLFIGTFSVLSLFDLLKPLHINSPSIEHKFLATIIALFILFILFRIAMVLFGHARFDFMNAGWLAQFSILFFTLYSITFSFGFLWLLQRHLENQIKVRATALKEANIVTDKLRLQAERAALHDPLTLAGNRRKFENIANSERKRHLRYNHGLCLAFVDIDHFKALNDKFGHAVGDQVLAALVTYFVDVLRDIDMVYRWGGEEFIILLPETTLQQAIIVCERIRKHVQTLLIIGDESITVSIGVRQLKELESINDLVKRADELLYEAKQNGRNRVIGR